jgi:hypothetical protein
MSRTLHPLGKPRVKVVVTRKAALRERHHSAPELRALARVDVILAHEGQLAVTADAIDRDSGRQCTDSVAVPDQHRHNARRQEKSPGRIDAERAKLDTAAVDVLDQDGLTSFLIELKHRNVVLAAGKDIVALELNGARGTIRDVSKPAIGMDVDFAAGDRRLTPRCCCGGKASGNHRRKRSTVDLVTTAFHPAQSIRT